MNIKHVYTSKKKIWGGVKIMLPNNKEVCYFEKLEEIFDLEIEKDKYRLSLKMTNVIKERKKFFKLIKKLNSRISDIKRVI